MEGGMFWNLKGLFENGNGTILGDVYLSVRLLTEAVFREPFRSDYVCHEKTVGCDQERDSRRIDKSLWRAKTQKAKPRKESVLKMTLYGTSAPTGPA